MDLELAQRLLAGKAPFEAETVSPTSMLPLEGLAVVLGSILDEVRASGQGRPLYMLHDRHEADGVLTVARTVPWERLDETVSGADTLFAARSGEPLVSVGFYHADPSFYLRMNIMEEDEDEAYPGRWGDFDLTGSAEHVASIRERLETRGLGLSRIPAHRYFRERAAQWPPLMSVSA